uniref:Uncharacterized protein n=1 Tax=Physcomitrium patens TaxID=3218 RepID=A0A2K1J5A4_PHYPA|nr:hypothetical protein PHYPA_022549 [Physcomitrium patens]
MSTQSAEQDWGGSLGGGAAGVSSSHDSRAPLQKLFCALQLLDLCVAQLSPQLLIGFVGPTLPFLYITEVSDCWKALDCGVCELGA